MVYNVPTVRPSGTSEQGQEASSVIGVSSLAFFFVWRLSVFEGDEFGDADSESQRCEVALGITGNDPMYVMRSIITPIRAHTPETGSNL